MNIFGSIKDHVMIGGPNAISGWVLLFLLVLEGGFAAGSLRAGVDLGIFLALLAAAALTGNGVYALNAVYDLEADKINKPNRPLPSGRMTREHALKYSYGLMAFGLLVCALASVYSGDYRIILLWSIFTLLGFAYSIPPLKLKARHIFGNLSFGAFAGLAFLTGMMLVHMPINMGIWLFLLLQVFYIGGLVTMKDFCDVEGDEKNGDVTLPVKVGRGKAAIISIVMMALSFARIPLIPYGYVAQPPILDYFLRNWFIMAIFVVYILLDRVGKGHVISDAYSKVLYYYVILFTAYELMGTAIIPTRLAPMMAIIFPIVALVSYTTIATVVTHRSWKMGQNIFKPL